MATAGGATSFAKVICFHCRRWSTRYCPICASRRRAAPALNAAREHARRRRRVAIALSLSLFGAALAGAMIGGALALFGS
jgi:hypothetical protein